MIKIENVSYAGFEPALRGMRNPKNSWAKSDSHYCLAYQNVDDCPMAENGDEPCECHDGSYNFCVGMNDMTLAKTLCDGGPVHAKFRRMIMVWCDIVAPLYWWKEFDTYRSGVEKDSCSTMHTITQKEFTLDDFSHDHLNAGSLDNTIQILNNSRSLYLNGWKGVPGDDIHNIEPKDHRIWYQIIQLLPSSYNQRRTVMMSYEALAAMYKWRKNHKLDEWREFCKWIETLPYAKELIVCFA